MQEVGRLGGKTKTTTICVRLWKKDGQDWLAFDMSSLGLVMYDILRHSAANTMCWTACFTEL